MLVYNDLGTGTPLVLIHGLGSKKEAWLPQHELANTFRLVIPDLRGHGETKLDDDFTIKNFALDIIKLLDYLKISSAFICGLSLGGIVAQEIYKQRPGMVKGLILSNTTSYIPFFFANGIISSSSRLFQKGKEELMEHILSTSLYDAAYREEAEKIFHIRDSYMEAAKATVGVNYFPTLLTIRKPVLLIGSSHDNVTPAFNLYLMKSFIRGADISILQDSGHLSNIEKRELFNQHVKDFIAASSKAG